MPSEYTIQQLLNIGDLSAVLASVDNGKNIVFKGGVLDPMLPRTIVRVKRALAIRYSANPSDSTLRSVGEYLLQLCGPYALRAQQIISNLSGALPVITGPNNVSINVGQTATFSVTVVSSTSVTYQWFRGGVLIPGATNASYSLTNAQLSDSGAQFSVVATNSTGSVTSNTAILTVTAAYVGFYYQGTTDYSTDLMGGTDNVPYLGTFPITTGNPLVVTFPNLVATQYIVVKYPAAETTKTSFLNPPPSGPDGGPIPNISLEETTIGAWKYIFSRTGNTFGLNSVNGEVQFS